MSTDGLFDAAGPPERVRLRLLPWRPRWRTGDPDDLDLGGLGDALDLPDDPVSALVGAVLLLLALPALIALVLGAAVLGLEVLLLLPLGLLLLVGRLCHLRPWVLVLRWPDGRRALVEVRGLGAARRRRRALLAGPR